MHTISHPTPFNQKTRLAALWIISICLAAVILISKPMLSEESMLHEVIETAGLALLGSVLNKG